MIYVPGVKYLNPGPPGPTKPPENIDFNFTSRDPQHDISIICLHAMVGSMLPWS